MNKDSTELVRKVFEAQKQDPTPGDFIKLVEKDMLELDITMKYVEESTKVDLKKALKASATNASFAGLKKKLLKHKKVKQIQYDLLEMQPYLRSEKLQAEERQTITALRSKCVRSVKTNFSSMGGGGDT